MLFKLLNQSCFVICFGLLCQLLVAQEGLFFPFDPTETQTVVVGNNTNKKYQFVNAIKINSEIPGRIEIEFNNTSRHLPRYTSNGPLAAKFIALTNTSQCIIYPDFVTDLGRSVTIFSDSSWVFELIDFKTFTIKTNASLGESWMVYALLNGSKVIGKIVSIQSGNTTDEWIKTIELTTEINPHLPSGSFEFHKFIKVSNLRGLLEFPALSGFGTISDGITHHSLPATLLNRTNSIQNFVRPNGPPVFRQIWDLKADDIIVSERKQNFDIYRDQLKVMESHWDEDSLSVHFVWQVTKSQLDSDNQATFLTSYVIDTTIIKKGIWLRLDSLAPLTVFEQSDGKPLVDAITMRSSNDFYNDRKYYHFYNEGSWNPNKMCFEEVVFSDNYFSISEYLDGLGGPYKYVSGLNSGGFYKNSHYIIYYKKGVEEWGDPGVLTSIESQETVENSLQIFPSITSSCSDIYINQMANPKQVTVVDIQGRKKHAEIVSNEGQMVIHLKDFVQGMYFVIFEDQNGNRSTGKFIVREAH